jgi:hypothetical protein
MGPATTAGVQIGVPGGSGITILEAKVWWQASPQISGATTFGLAADNDGAVGESLTPMTGSEPATYVLPSTTTEITLANYCSNDDAGAGCTFGSGENNILELYGELYPEVVDAREEEGGVPSRLTKTDRRKAGKEGTPWQMFAGSLSGRAMMRLGSRWTTSRGRARGG